MNLNLRPVVSPSVLDSKPTLRFQILSVEVFDHPLHTFDSTNTRGLVSDAFYSVGDDEETGCDRAAHPCHVCVFGVSSTGASVMTRVRGFMPHFFIEVTPTITVQLIKCFVQELRQRYSLSPLHIRMETVMRKRVYGWVPDATDASQVRQFKFVRVSFRNTWLLRVAKRIIDDRSLPCLKRVEVMDVSEAKVASSEKFLASRGLKPSGWAEVSSYRVVSPETRLTMAQVEVQVAVNGLTPLKRDTIAPLVIASVDIEAHSHDYRSFPEASNPGDVVSFIGTTFWVYGDSAPRTRVMHVLGECAACPPDAGIQIRSFSTEGEMLMDWRDLIAVHADPDFMVSYNGTGFDYAYLAARIRSGVTTFGRFTHLGRVLMHGNQLRVRELTSAAKGQNILSSFPQPGRVQMDLFMYVKDSQKLSSYKLDDVCAAFLKDTGKVVLDFPDWVSGLIPAAGQALVRILSRVRPDKVPEVETLVARALEQCPSTGDYTDCHASLVEAVDVVNAALSAPGYKPPVPECNMKPFTTRSLSLHGDLFIQDVPYVDPNRLDMDTNVQPALDASGDNNYRKLFRLYEAGAEQRAAIAVYCQVDCDLVVQLLDRLNVVANTFQMSQVCNTLADDVSNRGQQIKTFNLISRYALEHGYVMNQRESGWDPEAVYEGATVLEPTPGYYQKPVATLDFASLYPSLMRGYNLCPSSLVLDDEYKNLEGVKYGRYDLGGKTWVFQESTPGLLPDILGSLLDARKAKKREMKAYEKGSLEHRLCDGAQLALKVSCNSVYGFCGVTNNGMFPCMPVAVATTYNGRESIALTKAFVEQTYDATVIYGDTDSVMLTFPGVDTVHDAFTLAEQVGRETTAIFPSTVLLEFEKVYSPYLLLKRKTYAGLKYEDDPDLPPSLDVKGLATVRRDNCGLVRDVMKKMLNLTMRDNNPLAAYEVVKDAVDRLVADTVPLSDLQITNSLKSDEAYTNDAQPQLAVVRKMRARKAFDIPRPGDRVPFVITEDSSLARVSDRAEHPRYVQDHADTVKVDTNYYLINQLQRRLDGIMSLLPVPSVDRLFETAVACVKARGLDTSSITNLCTATPARKSTDTHLKKVSSKKTGRVTKRDADMCTSSLAAFYPGRARARVPAVSPLVRKPKLTKQQVDAGSISLLSFFKI